MLHMDIHGRGRGRRSGRYWIQRLPASDAKLSILNTSYLLCILSYTILHYLTLSYNILLCTYARRTAMGSRIECLVACPRSDAHLTILHVLSYYMCAIRLVALPLGIGSCASTRHPTILRVHGIPMLAVVNLQPHVPWQL